MRRLVGRILISEFSFFGGGKGEGKVLIGLDVEQGLGDSAGGFCAYAYAVGYVPRLGTTVHYVRYVFFFLSFAYNDH